MLRTVFSFLMLLALPAGLCAQPLQLPVQAFTADQGLGGATITSLATDARGFLWLGTPDELLLYDGKQFLPFRYRNSSGDRVSFRRAVTLSTEAEGFLILHEEGGHQYNSTSGRLLPTQVPFAHSTIGVIASFTADKNHTGWYRFVSSYGSSNYNPQTQQWRGTQQGNSQRSNMPPLMQGEAALWISERTLTGEIYFTDPFTGAPKDSFQSSFPVASAVQMAGGYLLLSEEAVPKIWWKRAGASPKLLATLGASAFFLRMVAAGNTVYISAGSSLFQFLPATGTVREIRSETGGPLLAKGVISHLLLRENTLWVGTNAGGLLRISLSGARFEHLHSKVPNQNFIHAILPDSAGTFTGAFYGAFVRYNKEGQFAEDLTPYLKPPYTQSETFYFNHLERLSNGFLFIVGGRSAYLFHPEKYIVVDLTRASEKALVEAGVDPAKSPGRRTVRRAGKDQWWITEAGGLALWTLQGAGKRARLSLQKFIPLPGPPPEGLCFWEKSWWGATAGKLYKLTSNGIADSFVLPLKSLVTALQPDAAGRLWIATESGLMIWKSGQVMEIRNTENGLPNNHVYTLLPDSTGWMWGSSNRGLFAVHTTTGEVRSYTDGEGLQGAEFNSGAMATDTAGRFYFGGMNGVNVFKPAEVLQTSPVNAVTITKIAAPDTVYYRYPSVAQLPSLSLLHDRAHLQLSYTAAAINNAHPPRYEYRLNAGERWTEAAPDGELQFTLAPGNYMLQIRVVDAPKSAAQLSVKVAPPFYQQPLFLALVLAGGSAFTATVFWVWAKARYRRQATRLEGEKKMQAEKERISRELHDELGARAALIAHNVGQLEKAAGKADKAVVTALTSRITNTTTDMLTALRETVWTLKQESVTAASLWMRYKNFIAKLNASYHHLHFEVVEEALEELSGAPLHYAHALNALRILQEAAMNAVRHSGGTVITVSVERPAGRICFLITDNGQGFDVEGTQASSQGNGLQNMAQRSAESHFGLTIKSPAGGGTQVCLCL